MNQARQQLSQGISVQEVENFRQWVSDTVAQVEEISRQYNVSPEQLSAPTYRAYLYLKNLDLNQLPVDNNNRNKPAANRGEAKFRIQNLVASCNRIQQQMSEIALKSFQPSKRGNNSPAILEMEKQIHREAEDILSRTEHIFQKEGRDYHSLPAPSQRAYLWLKFLSQPGKLHTHLNALQLAYQFSRQASCLNKLPSRLRKFSVQVTFYNISALYRTKIVKDSIQITANEAFVTGSEKLFDDLICSALLKDHRAALGRLRQHASGAEFSEAVQALQTSQSARVPDTHGRVYDLQEVFDRVNANYFNRKMEQPRLTWNRTITARKLGHYQPQTDTVMISITLDQPNIPAYLIDFIMYHELLHKKLGVQQLNGRRYAHNKKFRDEERKYLEYAKAQEFMQLLHQKVPGLKLLL
jgi:hypothetical protein